MKREEKKAKPTQRGYGDGREERTKDAQTYNY